MKLYAVIVLFLIGLSACSQRSPETLMAEAKLAEEKKDFSLAVNLYTELTTRHPRAAQAEEAQYKIALIYNNELHDAGKAVEAYRTLYTTYPASQHAPSAMFLCGFLFNNELQNIDSARAVYGSFLQAYPDHELAASARFELETLGKDPEAVLKNDILATEPPAADDAKASAK